MNRKKYKKLLSIAKDRMRKSHDPVHDYMHVKRVVETCETFAEKKDLTQTQRDALKLAAWWHDVGRTSIKKPSIVLMPFFDDMLSAYMLWRMSLQVRMFGPAIGMACRIILCNSMGTGKLFARLLMRKRNRVLADMLADADTIDILHVERVNILQQLASRSWLYSYGYKLSIWFFLTRQSIVLHTEAGKKYFLEVLQLFVDWIQTTEVREWHINTFGKKWFDARMAEAKEFAHSMNIHFSPQHI